MNLILKNTCSRPINLKIQNQFLKISIKNIFPILYDHMHFVCKIYFGDWFDYFILPEWLKSEGRILAREDGRSWVNNSTDE